MRWITELNRPIAFFAAWAIVLSVGLASPASFAEDATSQAPDSGWISLFNGKDLEGWTPKLRGHELGDNFGDTFRVEDGVIKVSYDKYETFGDKFGHLFYQSPFSNYRLRIEYRFVGEQVAGGAGWATRNSGVMLHCQDPATMRKDQEFPVSIEVQFLGGLSDGKERSTANLCTPGTHVVMNDKLTRTHCINSKSPTFNGDEWVTAEIEVNGSGAIRHYVNGDLVLEYAQPQYDDRDGDGKELIKDGQVLISGGFIALQSESHPIEFRKVEILPTEE